MTKPFGFIDTETNTLLEHRLPWEIGLVMDFPEGVVEWGVQIEDYYGDMDPAAAQVNRFSERFMQDSRYSPMPLRDAAKAFRDLLDNVVFVGSNPAFDQGSMRNLFLHAGLIPNWHYRSIDVCTLVSGHLKTYVPSMLKAAELMEVEHDLDTMHSALVDAHLARNIFHKVMSNG